MGFSIELLDTHFRQVGRRLQGKFVEYRQAVKFWRGSRYLVQDGFARDVYMQKSAVHN